MEIIALVFSAISLAISIKAYLNSQWIEIDWNFEDDDRN